MCTTDYIQATSWNIIACMCSSLREFFGLLILCTGVVLANNCTNIQAAVFKVVYQSCCASEVRTTSATQMKASYIIATNRPAVLGVAIMMYHPGGNYNKISLLIPVVYELPDEIEQKK